MGYQWFKCELRGILWINGPGLVLVKAEFSVTVLFNTVGNFHSIVSYRSRSEHE